MSDNTPRIATAVAGASGRMGRTLVQAIAESRDLRLAGAFEHPDNPFIGNDAGELAGVGRLEVPIVAGAAGHCSGVDVVIDFTVPAATLGTLKACVESGSGMVIGTTGFSEGGLAEIRAAAAHIPIMMSPNMSAGVNLVFKLLEVAAKALGDTVDIEVIEAHHRHKIDAPSGTAVRMGEVLAAAVGRNLDEVAVYGRQGITGARDRATIGFETIRAGDIVGDHTVLFAGEGERIEITHRAHSRLNFAYGALRAARFLKGRPAGMYTMAEVLGI